MSQQTVTIGSFEQTASPAMYLWRLAYRSAPFSLLSGTVLPSLAGVLAVPAAYMLALGISRAIEQELLLEALLVWLGFVLLRALLNYGSEQLLGRAMLLFKLSLRHQLYQALLERGPVLLREQALGQLSLSLIEKVDLLEPYYTRYLPQLYVALTVPLAIILVALPSSAAIAAILLGCYLLLPVLLAFSGILAGRASARQMQALNRMGSLFFDRLRHLVTLRIFGAVAREQQHLAAAAANFRQRTMAVLRLAFLSSAAVDFVALGGFIAVGWWLYSAPLSLVAKLFMLLLTAEFFAPLRALSATYHDRANALAALPELRSILQASAAQPVGRKPAPAPLIRPSFEFRNISFTYPGRQVPALRHFSLRVEGTEFLALKGPSGSGKSTLIHLLLGFIRPDEGALYLANHDLSQIDPVERNAAFAWVGQRPYLFHGSIRDNLLVAAPSASDDDLFRVLQQVRLDRMVAQLPEGIATMLGEGGYGLSGGQAQRLALARAMLREAPVLLLDEPTAGLDAATAQEIMQLIQDMAQSRTVLMVSHDPLALSFAERIEELEAIHA